MEVLDIVEAADFAKLSPSERIADAYTLKEAGTRLFNQGKYSFALQDYSKAISMLENDFSFDKDSKAESTKVKFSCGLNMAACQLKLGELVDVIGICSALLEQDPTSSKAAFRRGQAHEQRGETDSALKDYSLALTLSGGDVAVRRAMDSLQKVQREQDKKDRETFKNMFGSS
jgi:tetratricopeptide (TPR) repeat protein